MSTWCFCIPDEAQRAFYEIRLWQEYARHAKIMVGGPTPPEWEVHNSVLRAEVEKKIAAFVPKPCPHKESLTCSS